jgi:LPXTG-motif cell wall-anchored protein
MTCTVSDRVVTGGEDVTVTAQSSSAVAATWTLTYEGQNRNRSGNPVSATFDTDEVDEPTQTIVTATVTQGGNSATCNGTVVLLPRDGDGDGDGDGNGGGSGDNGGLLPNTGGERLVWLIIGGILVLAGGGVVVASRRREA